MSQEQNQTIIFTSYYNFYSFLSFLFLSTIFLVIYLHFIFPPSRIQLYFWKLDSFLHRILYFLVYYFHLSVENIINHCQCSFFVLIELNYEIYSFLVLPHPCWWSFLNGNVQSEVPFLQVLWFDGHSAWVDDFLADIILIFILRVRDSSNGVFEGDFLLMVFDRNDWFLKLKVILFGWKIDDTDWWGDFNWEWDWGNFDVVFGGLRGLSHWGKILGKYYKEINF